MLTPAPHIHHATDGQGALVLDTRSETWMMLGPDASRIWTTIVTYGTTEGLADELAIPSGRDPHAVRLGIDNLVTQWQRDGLLIEPAAPARRRKWWQR
ncbi:hypothetical protein ACPCTN_03165 [Streptomyces cinereoruber]|uniref:hypothetical protein n=1 Tax=Streptomyces cinereoruber TaxID=67260 RepID=UPI003C2E8E71